MLRSKMSISLMLIIMIVTAWAQQQKTQASGNLVTGQTIQPNNILLDLKNEINLMRLQMEKMSSDWRQQMSTTSTMNSLMENKFQQSSAGWKQELCGVFNNLSTRIDNLCMNQVKMTGQNICAQGDNVKMSGPTLESEWRMDAVIVSAPTTTLLATTSNIPTTAPICDFECENGGTCTARNHCTCPSDFSGVACQIQSAGLCSDDDLSNMKPILLISFGSGSTKYSSAKPADFNFKTTYKQTFAPKTQNGMFTFVNEVPNDYGISWHIGAKDHTTDENGYMYLVNADVSAGEFYNGQINGLCVGVRYEFSVYLANICKPKGKGNQGRINPKVRFEVRSLIDNKLLAQVNSGDVVENSSLAWKKFGLSFIANSGSVKLLMISAAPGGGGNDLVIDDIALRACTTTGTGLCPPK